MCKCVLVKFHLTHNPSYIGSKIARICQVQILTNETMKSTKNRGLCFSNGYVSGHLIIKNVIQEIVCIAALVQVECKNLDNIKICCSCLSPLLFCVIIQFKKKKQTI